MKPVKLAVIGVGLIGRRHAELICDIPQCRLVGTCDIDAEKKGISKQLGAPFFRSIEEMIESVRPEGAIVATPNASHAEAMKICAAHGVDVLIEKPISDSIETARSIVKVGQIAGIRVLVGYHRRHNPLVQQAHSVVAGGEIGDLVGVSMVWALMKPNEYFNIEWRTMRPGGGPILINLVHEFDILRYVCGEIVQVFAHTSSAARNFGVEDSVSVSLIFENGAVGSITASDGTAAPWSYEETTQENPYYFHTGESCYYFLGTGGALAFPRMELWRYAGGGSQGWQHPLEKRTLHTELENPLEKQLKHFCEVVRGLATPAVDGEEGVRSLAVALAALKSGMSNRPVDVAEIQRTASQ